jgi:hypothetical protein
MTRTVCTLILAISMHLAAHCEGPTPSNIADEAEYLPGSQNAFIDVAGRVCDLYAISVQFTKILVPPSLWDSG